MGFVKKIILQKQKAAARTLTMPNRAVNTAAYTEEGMTVTMDISMFKPEEVKITVEGQWLIIEALQDTFSMEHSGLLHRHSLRRYMLPPNADLKSITISIREGILKVHVPQIIPEMKRQDD